MANQISEASEPNLSEKDAAKLLGISRISLFRLRRQGAIGYYIVRGRVLYAPAHLRAYLASVERPARRRG